MRATSDRTTREPGQPGVRLRCLDVRQVYSIAQSGAGGRCRSPCLRSVSCRLRSAMAWSMRASHVACQARNVRRRGRSGGRRSWGEGLSHGVRSRRVVSWWRGSTSTSRYGVPRAERATMPSGRRAARRECRSGPWPRLGSGGRRSRGLWRRPRAGCSSARRRTPRQAGPSPRHAGFRAPS
ncbi:DUF6207 family protein [Streptomyces sp. NPDC059994]|uniref:DUF6207 family protein n=1 Tax=Streptomyces sp. NPDC059994 TaxID=3347029 RepID=UPI00368589A6